MNLTTVLWPTAVAHWNCFALREHVCGRLLTFGALGVLAVLSFIIGAVDVLRGRSKRRRFVSGAVLVTCVIAMYYALRTIGNSLVVLFTAGALLAYGIGTLLARLRFQRNRTTL